MRRYIVDLDDTLAYTTRDLKGDPKRIPELKPVEGALEFLRRHSHMGRKRCILLTAGNYAEQQQKIDVLGIRNCFRRIHVVPTPEDKLKKLEEIVGGMKRWRSSFNIVIIGDRLDVELSKGVQLGCITARIRIPGGRHSHEMSTGNPVHQTHWMEAKDFTELMEKYPGLVG